jgi:hypothetical protein
MSTQPSIDTLVSQFRVSGKEFSKGLQLVEYIKKNKLGMHSEFIFEFGIHVAQNEPQ